MALTVSNMISALGDKIYEYLTVEDGADISANVQLLDAIASANAKADSYLRRRYTLPLESEPTELIAAKVDIARHRLLCLTRPELNPEKVNRADILYDEAIKYLEQLRDGTIVLTFEPENRFERIANSQTVVIGGNVTASQSQLASKQSWFNCW